MSFRVGAERRQLASAILAIAILALYMMVPAATAQAGPNSLTLLWVAPGDDADQGQVSSYEMHYSTSPPADAASLWNSPASQILTWGASQAAAGETDSTQVTGLTPSTTYYFVLRARDEWFNTSDYSNVASATTGSCNAPVVPPSNFVAAEVSGDVSLNWDPTSDPLAVSVHVYRAPASGGSWTLIHTVAIGTTTYLDQSVSPGVTYRYRLAYMGTACDGPTTSIATVSIPGPAPPPGAAATGTPKIHAYPNPSSGPVKVVVSVESSVSTYVYIRLFDLTGHWIATIADGTYAPGDTEVAWNRIGRDGRTVGPGYYEILGTVGITKVRERLVLLP